jgi:V/A-type H+-transporting ATPase subunit D
MADIKVNPTRMELKKLKNRLITARRGHKLLKDKRDELMRQFLDIVREAAELRQRLNDEFASVDESFAAAAAESDPRMLTEALLLPGAEGELTVGTKNIMSVLTPVFDYKTVDAGQRGGVSYGLAFTSGSLDGAVREVSAAAADLVKLAQLEKSAMLLCDEIERTRRRVNALEYIMIPQYERGVKTISMKLDENERGSQTRLMKVKDMMLKAAIEDKAHHDDDEDEAAQV